jgi:aryl-alcohol dehydrogenase-like predicted oxidoreductase
MEKVCTHHNTSKKQSIPPEQLALEWVLDHSQVDVVIIGPRKRTQIDVFFEKNK